MTHAPIFSTMLGANGSALSNVVIGPMLAEREYLSTQVRVRARLRVRLREMTQA